MAVRTPTGPAYYVSETPAPIAYLEFFGSPPTISSTLYHGTGPSLKARVPSSVVDSTGVDFSAGVDYERFGESARLTGVIEATLSPVAADALSAVGESFLLWDFDVDGNFITTYLRQVTIDHLLGKQARLTRHAPTPPRSL